MSMSEAKVVVGGDHQPSASTKERADALKDEGNKLLQGGPARGWRFLLACMVHILLEMAGEEAFGYAPMS